MRTVNKSSCYNGGHKNGTVAMGEVGSRNCVFCFLVFFLRIGDVKTCMIQWSSRE